MNADGQLRAAAEAVLVYPLDGNQPDLIFALRRAFVRGYMSANGATS